MVAGDLPGHYARAGRLVGELAGGLAARLLQSQAALMPFARRILADSPNRWMPLRFAGVFTGL